MAMGNKVVDIIPPKDIWVGNENAGLVITQIVDYEDDGCYKAHEIVVTLVEELDKAVNFGFRQFPLTNIHQRAHKAAEAAVAAAQEGKCWKMHSLSFRNRRKTGITSPKGASKAACVLKKKR